jgi:competence protein ComGC
MNRRASGFTMVEMLVVATAVFVLGGMFAMTLGRAREQARRSSCGNDLGCIMASCHLYSDLPANNGAFPALNGQHNADGRKAMAMLYGDYVRDHRVYRCPSNPSDTAVLEPYSMRNPNPAVLVEEYTNFGYDPGHTPTHATAGVVSDLGTLHSTNHKNSMNHGSEGPGQNVGIGAGSVEWWDAADELATKDANDNARMDDIFADNLDEEIFPEELETNIIQ